MSIIHVFLRFLRPLQFNSDERKPAYFSTHTQCQSYYVNSSRRDCLIARQNLSLAINIQLILSEILSHFSEFMQFTYCHGGLIVVYFSKLTVESVYKSFAEVFLLLGCIEDQASFQLMVEYSRSTTIQRSETV